MRENRPYGSEGGEGESLSLPLSAGHPGPPIPAVASQRREQRGF